MTKIVIDPGHGGRDTGAVYGECREKDFTLQIALKVRDYLKSRYVAEVLMTRTTDKTVSLTARTDFANRNKANYYCSIHINAGGGTGWESYIYNGSVSNFTKSARNTIHSTVMNVIGPQYGVRDRGKKRANFHVLRESHMPAILMENMFIDTERDRNLLRSQAFISDLANGIGAGLAKALQLSPKARERFYKVIAGSFLIPQNAFNRQSFLRSKGIGSIIVKKVVSGKTVYRVQAGAFRKRANAEARLQAVKKLGISDAFILVER
ncbi:N-acetylmuramoyl-L-alanine amidase [Salinithrix halophila]|uniref:N-acetylmuramoyl-L-alanine amidase n=1 Tax=Salinithrix halophila TaxID=1485204 RepID=A0ABV8JGY6_9BACL